MKGGFYRPTVYHRARAGLDGDGRVVGWEHVIVGKSILIGSPFEATMVKNGVDSSSVEGVSDTPYAIPNFRTEVHNAKEGVPVLWWRSVGHTHTAQAMEVFVDELARAAGKDPVEFRLVHARRRAAPGGGAAARGREGRGPRVERRRQGPRGRGAQVVRLLRRHGRGRDGRLRRGQGRPDRRRGRRRHPRQPGRDRGAGGGRGRLRALLGPSQQGDAGGRRRAGGELRQPTSRPA